jgi:hypothetical protein
VDIQPITHEKTTREKHKQETTMDSQIRRNIGGTMMMMMMIKMAMFAFELACDGWYLS